jgi:prophage regulatory protein
MRLLSYEDVKAKGVNYTRQSLWRLEREQKFPKRVPIGEARIGWLESEIDAWIESRVAARSAA